MKRIFNRLKKKWPKYLIEIIVIVIGILGAFALNTWNENSQRKSEVRKSLFNMLEEMQQDSAQFAIQKYSSDKVAKHLIQVIEIIKKEAGFHPDSLEFHHRGAQSYTIAVLQRNSYESMSQLGLLSHIRDDDLIYDIQYYYNFIHTNIRILREFELERYKATMASINTDKAIIMSEASWDDLPRDYNKIGKLLLTPTNFSKLYSYGETQRFLVDRSNEYIQQNAAMLSALRTYLDIKE